jgi:hypothetical protein
MEDSLLATRDTLIAVAFLAQADGISVAGAVASLALLWYGAETLLVVAAGWPLSPKPPPRLGAPIVEPQAAGARMTDGDR